ncbi:MAG: pyridoxal 5'-phosphate synthase glutaminase subunit PdxT [Candidatus Caldatribacterium sp.]|nr:pyridoxal 5'-phosphate synthase glutaminase subunit PdxT [Candidatus Caldatribacterium sp.]
MKVGILGFQGGIEEHERMLHSLGVDTHRVRYVQDLAKIDALILPGGESTTMGVFLRDSGLLAPLRETIEGGMPTLATCAGLILLAQEVEGKTFASVGLLPIAVQRNAYGRQRESFTTELLLSFDPARPYPGVFIRAPRIERILSPEIQTLSLYEGQPVMVEYGKIIGCTFHPELTEDPRVHEYFLSFAGL